MQPESSEKAFELDRIPAPPTLCDPENVGRKIAPHAQSRDYLTHLRMKRNFMCYEYRVHPFCTDSIIVIALILCVLLGSIRRTIILQCNKLEVCTALAVRRLALRQRAPKSMMEPCI